MRFSRLALVLALAAAPAAAQNRGRAPVPAVAPLPPSAAGAVLHPALLSPDGPSGAPLAAALNAGAARVAAALRAPAAAAAPVPAAAVLGRMAAGEPLERAAAGVLAHALSDTRAASALILRMPGLMYGDLPALAGRRVPLGDAAALADDARERYAFLFDGRTPAGAAAPGGASLDGETLVADGRRTPALGRGFFGVVHPHPEVEGAVVKTDLPRALSRLGETKGLAEWRVEKDAQTAEAAARVGAGPRVLGRGVVDGRPAVVKERVYGVTVERLLEDDAFAAEHHALVEDLFMRIGRSGISFADPRPGNVMIGRTLANPELRAYLIDGGETMRPKAGASAVDTAEWLFGYLRQLAHGELLGRFDKVHFSRPVPEE